MISILKKWIIVGEMIVVLSFEAHLEKGLQLSGYN